MRYFEIASGMRLPVSGEEQELLNMVGDHLAKDDLDERMEELARLMVSRGVLAQFMKDQQVYYRPNSVKDIWRNRDG
jgi:hypothetical protein